MHKFSIQLSFLENLLLAVIRSHPLEGDKSKSDETRLTRALLALTGNGLGTGSSGLNDELALLAMAKERTKDLAYTGPLGEYLPQDGRPEFVKEKGKPRSIRRLAEDVTDAGYHDANAERLRGKYSENKPALQRAQTALGDDYEIQKGFEYQAIRKIITLLNQNGVDAKINEIEV